MPARRTSSRLRAGLGASSSAAAAGVAGGAGGSDGESSGGGGGCPPLPPSPGKRKARSPIEEEHARLTNPNPVRCMSFQSPKKKALGGGIGDRFSAPYDKENELLFGAAASAAAVGGIGSSGSSSSGLLAAPFGDGSTTTAFRLSAFSAFSHHAPKPAAAPAAATTPTAVGGGVGGGLHAAQKVAGGGTRRRNREENVSSAVRSRAPPTSTTSPRALPGSSKGSVLPFLLAPVSVTTSPDLRPRSTPSSRRLRRSGGTVSGGGGGGGGSGFGRSRQASSSTSSSTSSNASGRGGGSPPDAALTVPFSIGESLQQQQQQKRAEGVVVAPASTRQTTTPSFTPRRGRSRSAASNNSTGNGGGSGGWRATATAAAAGASTTAAALAADPAASNPTAVTDTSGGGGPAGSGRRAVGGARLGPGGGGGVDTMSEPDCSPHRSPIYRLTESLQKWDAGSRYASPPEAIGEDYDGADGDDACADAVGTGGRGGGGAGAGVAGRRGAGGGVTKDVGASWSGQELRRTLEKERASQGRRRRHSAASAHDMYPTRGRFGDHSPISPASSVASINLGPFDATTPASVGRPWRSSPRRGSEKGGGGGGGAGTGAGTGIGRRTSERIRGGGDGGGGSGAGEGAGAGAGDGSEERVGLVRMEGSWSDDETGPSGAAMKLAFSPRKASDARTPTGEELTPEAAGLRTGSGSGAGAGSGVSFSSSSRWQHPFSPVKSQRPGADELGGPSTPSLGSLALSANGDGAVPLVRGYLAASPEQHSMLSVRDLMDQGTDDEDDGRGSGGGGGAGAGATLVRRRHRRPRPELALRALEMPDTMDVTVVEGVAVVAAGATAPTPAAGSGATASGKKSARGGRGTTPNPLVSPELVGKGLAGDGAGFGSACTTGCGRWEGLEDSSGQLDGSSIISHDAPGTVVGDDSWIGSRGKGKGRDWGQSTSAFGILAGDEGQDGTAAFSRENSGLSGADTSSASDASTSFVKSRPIPDQSAFSSSRLSKGGAGAPHSPLGSSGGGSGGGPAMGPGPLCLTPRKSFMRCPPTPQRTPTWDGLEDSLLLEGAGSGGRVCGSESAGMSSRHSLRQSRLLASGGAAGVGASAGAGARTGMAIDAGLANASGDPLSESILSAAGEAGFGSSRAGSGGGAGGRDDDGRGGLEGGTGGRGGRGRGGRERSSFGGSSAGDRSGRGDAAKDASAGAGGAGGGTAPGGGEDTLGFKHDFVQMGPIGEGGFSVVWKVRARGTGRLYAIKRSKREFRGRRDRDRCLLEARALQRLGEHPGVLRFERAWQEEGHFCLQTELCELGTLKDFLERLPSRREIPEAAVWQVLQDVGQALRHVHATGLVHLDVKPANLLIGDEGGRLKLADFGMATAYGEGVDGIGDGQEGDTLYMAKELLSSTERLPSADMFSLGLTVYEVATRTELPGDGEDWHAMRDGRSFGLPSTRSKDLGAVLRQLMHPDPRQRPTASELCDHPHVANIVVSSNTGGGGGDGGSGGSGGGGGGAGSVAAVAVAGHERDDYVVSQARAWRAAEAAAVDHPSSGLRTPTGDMSTRYIFQQTG